MYPDVFNNSWEENRGFPNFSHDLRLSGETVNGAGMGPLRRKRWAAALHDPGS